MFSAKFHLSNFFVPNIKAPSYKTSNELDNFSNGTSPTASNESSFGITLDPPAAVCFSLYTSLYMSYN